MYLQKVLSARRNAYERKSRVGQIGERVGRTAFSDMNTRTRIRRENQVTRSINRNARKTKKLERLSLLRGTAVGEQPSFNYKDSVEVSTCLTSQCHVSEKKLKLTKTDEIKKNGLAKPDVLLTPLSSGRVRDRHRLAFNERATPSVGSSKFVKSTAFDSPAASTVGFDFLESFMEFVDEPSNSQMFLEKNGKNDSQPSTSGRRYKNGIRKKSAISERLSNKQRRSSLPTSPVPNVPFNPDLKVVTSIENVLNENCGAVSSKAVESSRRSAKKSVDAVATKIYKSTCQSAEKVQKPTIKKSSRKIHQVIKASLKSVPTDSASFDKLPDKHSRSAVQVLKQLGRSRSETKLQNSDRRAKGKKGGQKKTREKKLDFEEYQQSADHKGINLQEPIGNYKNASLKSQSSSEVNKIVSPSSAENATLETQNSVKSSTAPKRMPNALAESKAKTKRSKSVRGNLSSEKPTQSVLPVERKQKTASKSRRSSKPRNSKINSPVVDEARVSANVKNATVPEPHKSARGTKRYEVSLNKMCLL